MLDERENEIRKEKAEIEEREAKLNDTFLSIAEVARKLRISRPTVRTLIRDGKLPAIRVGRRIFRISLLSLEVFIEEEEKERK